VWRLSRSRPLALCMVRQKEAAALNHRNLRAALTERTYEIGIRKALGARRIDILIQFLLEAAALTGLGGIAGIAFGWVIALISRTVFPSLPAEVPAWAAVMGIVMSVGVGLFFGIWPANKAARLDPVVALRYE